MVIERQKINSISFPLPDSYRETGARGEVAKMVIERQKINSISFPLPDSYRETGAKGEVRSLKW